MKRWGEQKPIRFDEKEMRTGLGSDNFIFVGSSCDIFADDIPNDWIRRVMVCTNTFDKNRYLFQTKNPGRIASTLFGLSANLHTICTTIETNRWLPEVMGNAPRTFDRAEAMGEIHGRGFKTMATIEPILDFEIHSMITLIKTCAPFQVNIGADSGRNGLPEPSAEKVRELITELEKFTKVVKKKNLGRLLNAK
jgi:DNA repair photolyase